ncbi:peptide deformylase [Candidatus Uhrbacteria bacterium]|nr:peptide deformylase [Candidatus Uhrbacteria bacterium]
MILDIVTHPNPILRKKAQNVADISHASIQKLIDDMIPTMYMKDGIGLAAPQVGESLQITVIIPDHTKFEEYKKNASEALVVINPKIIRHSLLTNKDQEGCLSVPHVVGTIKRWNWVTVAFFDRHGQKHKMRVKDYVARIFQHEIDHLNGTLFIDKAKNILQVKEL